MQKRYEWTTRLLAGVAATMLLLVAHPAVAASASEEQVAVEGAPVEEVAGVAESATEDVPAEPSTTGPSTPEDLPLPEALPEPEPSPTPEETLPPVVEDPPAPSPEDEPAPEETPAPSPAPDKEPAPSPAPDDEPSPAPANEPTASPSPQGGGYSAGYDMWNGSRGEQLSIEWLGFLALSGLEPTEYALEDIPAEMLDLYQAATLGCPGLPWTVLAGVGKVETDHGRNVAVSTAGARGPMQFLPSTWEHYGIDGNSDGLASINDPADAVYSAASYLCDHGGGDPETLGVALYAYNHAWWYVNRVLDHADRYSTGSWDATELGQPVDREALLANPRLVVYPGGRADVALGQVDPRVLDLLALLTQQHEVTIVALQSGHSKYVAGTNRVSNHYHGRAVDIAAIDGEPVRLDSPRARALVLWLASLNGPQRPSEVGSPFADLQDQPGHFSNAAHMGHVHVGWGAGAQE